jgi:hypothetical protein
MVAVALLLPHTRQGLIESSIALSLNSRGFNECGSAAGVIVNQARYLVVVVPRPVLLARESPNELVYVACTQRNKLLR